MSRLGTSLTFLRIQVCSPVESDDRRGPFEVPFRCATVCQRPRPGPGRTACVTIAANLNAALATSLGQVPDSAAKDQGIRYGEDAAERLVELRADDGRFAPIVFDVPLVPGVWRPTPPAMAPFFDPWLGQVDLLVLSSPSRCRRR